MSMMGNLVEELREKSGSFDSRDDRNLLLLAADAIETMSEKLNTEILPEDIGTGLPEEKLKTYEDGLADAREVAKELFAGLSDSELESIFGKNWTYTKLMKLSPSEAMEKIQGYKNGRICIGNQVTDKSGKIGVVMKERVINGVENFFVWWNDGSAEIAKKEDIKNTGKVIETAGLLETISRGV